MKSNQKDVYRKWGKIRLAKHSRIRPFGVFRGALASGVYYLNIAKYSRKNFSGTLKYRESLAQRIFPRLRYQNII